MRRFIGILGGLIGAGCFAIFTHGIVTAFLGELPLAPLLASLAGWLGGGVAGLLVAGVSLSGGGGGLFEREQAVLRLAAARGGRLTLAEVATGCELSVSDSKSALEHLCGQGVADLHFGDDGVVVYAFPGLGAAAKRSARDPLREPEIERLGGAGAARALGGSSAGGTGGSSTALAERGSEALIVYSPKRRSIAGLLQILPAMVGFGGLGRFYAGHTLMGLAQLLLGPVAGIGLAWSIIDGLLTLVRGGTRDAQGRLLRPD